MTEHIEDRLRLFTDVAARMDDAVALIAVHELGVFTALVDGPMTAPELSARVAAAERRLRALLDMVVHVGYLERIGDHYALIDGDEAIFDPESPYYQALRFSTLAEALERRSHVLDVLRNDRPIEIAGVGGRVSKDERRKFLRYLHSRSKQGAEEVADLLMADDVVTIADLGCGLGTYAVALLKRLPNATAVLVDRPNAEDAVRELAEEEGVGDRVTFLPVDFLKSGFGDNFDLILMSNIVHCLSPEQNEVLVKRVAGSLRYGGRVAIKDLAVEPDFSGPGWALRFGFTMAMSSEGGAVYPEKQVVQWITKMGLSHEATITLRSAEGSYLVVGSRPETGENTVSMVQSRDAQRQRDKIVIIGGGIAGLASAITLRGAGFVTETFERVPAFTGKGLAFLIMKEGLAALDHLGAGESVRRLGRPIEKAVLRDSVGQILKEEQLEDVVCVRRSELVFLLRSMLPTDAVRRGMEFTGFERDQDGWATAAHFANGEMVRGGAFIAADGVRSRARRVLFPRHRMSRVRVMELVSMVRDVGLAEELNNTFIKTLGNEGGLACGIVPSGFGGVVWYVQFDVDRHQLTDHSTAAKRTFARRLVGHWPEPIPTLMDRTDFGHSHIWYTTDFELPPRLHQDNVLLVGDAGHTFLTFTSMGVGAALQDALALAECFLEHSPGDEVREAYELFESRRRPTLAGYLAQGRELAEQFLSEGLTAPEIPLVK